MNIQASSFSGYIKYLAIISFHTPSTLSCPIGIFIDSTLMPDGFTQQWGTPWAGKGDIMHINPKRECFQFAINSS